MATAKRQPKVFCSACGYAVNAADKAAHDLAAAAEHAKFGVACPACTGGVTPWGTSCRDCNGTGLLSALAAGAVRKRLNAEKAEWGEAAS